jgi:hypothetical protein
LCMRAAAVSSMSVRMMPPGVDDAPSRIRSRFHSDPRAHRFTYANSTVPEAGLHKQSARSAFTHSGSSPVSRLKATKNAMTSSAKR